MAETCRKVVGQLGMYGMIINAIQASSLEHDGMRAANWSGTVSECGSLV
jgi:hypothetical protein